MLKERATKNRCWAVRGIERWAMRGTKVFYGGRSGQAGMRPDGVDWGGYIPPPGVLSRNRASRYIYSPQSTVN